MTVFFHDLFGLVLDQYIGLFMYWGGIHIPPQYIKRPMYLSKLVYVGNTKINHDISLVPEIKLIMSLNYYYMLVITSFTKIIIDTAVLVLTLPTKMCMFAAFKSLKIM